MINITKLFSFVYLNRSFIWFFYPFVNFYRKIQLKISALIAFCYIFAFEREYVSPHDSLIIYDPTFTSTHVLLIDNI